MSDVTKPINFIKQIIIDDLKAGKNGGKVVTRFPPEPNGYLHIGHAKSICLNFGIARDFGGLCNLRFDDTNPVKEDVEYIESIMTDVKWLGFDWQDRLYYASDYFDKLYMCAEELINLGKAYVCSLQPEDIKLYRGTLTEPGKDSPYRQRGVAENLDLFRRMRAGEFSEGQHVLRAKIDMASPNMNMRDPLMYRIKKATHHRTGDKWCIYPLYDFAHCVSDALEGITHSICTLEFEDHRPLYDWFLDQLKQLCHPQQIEFARLNLNYTVMSKRKLLELVEHKCVTGWDDPRMPTISGMRRRGYTSTAIQDFAERVGVTKKDSTIDVTLLENSVREDLERKVPRVMAVLRPLKIIIDNFPEDGVEWLEAVFHPNEAALGTRQVPFARELYIEQDDFCEVPPPKYFRLTPGQEVRLRYAYIVRCQRIEKDAEGRVVAVHCTYDPDTKSGGSSTRKVKGTIHWVAGQYAKPAIMRLYDRLFSVPDPLGDKSCDFKKHLNPQSLEIVNGLVEPNFDGVSNNCHFQFERLGYFCFDKDSRKDHLVFNRIVTLRDSWASISGTK